MADIPDDLRESSEDVSRRAREAAAAMRKAAEKEGEKRAAIERAKAGAEQLAGGAISFSKTLVDSSGSMSKYGSAVNEAASGAGELLSAIGPFGAILGTFVKIAGKLVGSVLQANDTIIAGYDKLAEMGGATAFSTDSLRRLTNEMNWTVSSGAFTTLTDVIAEFGNNVTGLGTTAGVGIKNFMKITEIVPEVREEFNRLGLNQKKVAQLQASYLANEIKLGGRRYKDNETLRKESFSYIRNLVELSALTGENIDEIKKRQENDLKDIGYNLALQERMQRKNGQALKENIQRGVELAGQVDTTSRKAVMEVVAKGSAVGPAAAKLQQRFSQAGLDFVETVQSFEKGMIDENEFRKRFQQANKATFEKLGKGFQLDAQGLSDTFGMEAKTMEYNSKTIGDNTSQLVKDDVEAARKRKDDLKQTQSAIQDATTALTKAFDEFIRLISGPVNAAFRGLMYSLTALTKGIMKFVNYMGLAKNLGDKASVDPTLPFMFESVDDLLKQQSEANKEMIRIEKEFAKKGTHPKSRFEDPGSVTSLIRDPSLVFERGKYLEAEETYRGTTQQLEKLLGTEGLKKALAEREKNFNQANAKENANEKAAKEQRDAEEAKKQREQNKPPTPKSETPKGTPSTPAANNSPPKQGKESKPADIPPQKYMRGGIAQNPFNAKNLVSNLGGNAKIPLPSGIDIPADVSISEDLLQKLASMQSSAVPNKNMFSALQDVMKNIKIDAMPIEYDTGRKDLLKDSNNIENIMGSYTETLKKNLETTIVEPKKETNKTNNVNEILTLIVDKMDLLASKMKENTEIQNSTLLSSRR